MSIESFPANARVQRIMPALERDGVVILRRIVPDPIMDRLLKDIGSVLEKRAVMHVGTKGEVPDHILRATLQTHSV